MKYTFRNIFYNFPGCRFLYQEVPSDKFDIPMSARYEWVRDQINTDFEIRAALLNRDGIEQDNVVRILSEPMAAKNWNRRRTAPEHSADYLTKNSAKYVIGLQSALHLLGYGTSVGTIDGLFGGNTKRAVIEFQRSAGITVDGAPGPETIGAILDALGSTPPNPPDPDPPTPEPDPPTPEPDPPNPEPDPNPDTDFLEIIDLQNKIKTVDWRAFDEESGIVFEDVDFPQYFYESDGTTPVYTDSNGSPVKTPINANIFVKDANNTVIYFELAVDKNGNIYEFKNRKWILSDDIVINKNGILTRKSLSGWQNATKESLEKEKPMECMDEIALKSIVKNIDTDVFSKFEFQRSGESKKFQMSDGQEFTAMVYTDIQLKESSTGTLRYVTFDTQGNLYEYDFDNDVYNQGTDIILDGDTLSRYLG